MADGDPPQPGPRPMFPPGVDPSIKPGPRPIYPGNPDPRPFVPPTIPGGTPGPTHGDPPPGPPGPPGPKPPDNPPIIVVDPPGFNGNHPGRQLIDAWIAKNGLNQYGDPQGTAYAGGTPWGDRADNEPPNFRYHYIRQQHPDKPWLGGDVSPPNPSTDQFLYTYNVSKLPDGLSVEDFKTKIESMGGTVDIRTADSFPPQQYITVTFTSTGGISIGDFEKAMTDLGVKVSLLVPNPSDNLGVSNTGQTIPIAGTAGSSGVSPGSPGTGYPGEPESKGKIDVKIPPGWTGEPPQGSHDGLMHALSVDSGGVPGDKLVGDALPDWLKDQPSKKHSTGLDENANSDGQPTDPSGRRGEKGLGFSDQNPFSGFNPSDHNNT